MAAFLRGYLMGTRYCQVSPRPETDVVWKGSSSTIHEIRDTLNAGQFHVVASFFQAFIDYVLARRIARKQPLDHKL